MTMRVYAALLLSALLLSACQTVGKKLDPHADGSQLVHTFIEYCLDYVGVPARRVGDLNTAAEKRLAMLEVESARRDGSDGGLPGRMFAVHHGGFLDIGGPNFQSCTAMGLLDPAPSEEKILAAFKRRLTISDTPTIDGNGNKIFVLSGRISDVTGKPIPPTSIALGKVRNGDGHFIGLKKSGSGL